MRTLIQSALAAAALGMSTIVAAQSLVYQHNFDSIDGWPDSDANGDLQAVYTVVGSEYLINPLKNMAYALAPAPTLSPSADMVVESDVRLDASQSESRAGVACRVGRGQNFYAFNLIASGGYEIVRVQDGDPAVLATGAIDFDPSSGVRLKASCRGAELAFAVDGRELDRVSDSGLATGFGAGLLSVSPVVAATNAAFDNFSLSSFSGSSAVTATALPRSSAGTSTAAGGGGGNTIASGALPAIEDIAFFDDSGAGEPGDRKSLFSTGQQRVYLVVNLENATPAQFHIDWVAVMGSDERTIARSDYASPGNQRVWLYVDRDWTAGLYRADLRINGQPVEPMEFSVY